MMRTEYVTYTDGTDVYRGANLSEAIRAWDAATYQVAPNSGGISVQSWQGEVMVRDGWILHLHDNGVVYLNPNLTETH